MGFGWEDGLALANPIGWGPSLYKNLSKGNGYTPSAPVNTPPMTADKVKLLDPLKGQLGGYAKSGQNSLSDALGTLNNQATTSAQASGRVMGDYQGQALGRANTMASRGINDSVAGLLGGASLKDAQSQQEFEQKMALAREIGAMNSPTMLQEIIGGISGGANVAGQGASLYQALGNRGGGGGSSSGSLPPNLSLYDPYSSGYSRYR